MTSIRGQSDALDFWHRLTDVEGVRAFDVGANGGKVAQLLSERFTEVYAFEPAIESYKDLCENLIPNVTPVNVACSDKTDEIYLSVCERAIRSGQLTTGTRLDWGRELTKRPVESVRLDDAVTMFGAPDFVKVDTEGHEVRVLEGARDLIDMFQTTWAIEVHDASHLIPIFHLFDRYASVEIMRHHGYPRGSLGWRDHFYMWVAP